MSLGPRSFSPLRRAERSAACSALEAAGIECIPENGGAPGVRLRKRRSGPASIPVEGLTAENDERARAPSSLSITPSSALNKTGLPEHLRRPRGERGRATVERW